MIKGCKANQCFGIRQFQINEGREYVRGGKTKGGNTSGVSKMTGRNMCRREFVSDSLTHNVKNKT